MNEREQRGLAIAALCKLNQTGEGWLVPSQSGTAIYTVNPKAQTCTCPDHKEAGFKCKHLYAVEFTMKREVAADGTVTETKTLTFVEKKVYTQDWRAYNLAQSTEKDRFQVLLHDLCQGIEEPERPVTRGPKPHPVKDSIFAAALKVYVGFSARRSSCDFQEAYKRGYTRKPIPGMKVSSFLDNPDFTPILKRLIAESARPLRAVEQDFAIDSSGFSSCRSETWYDHKYGITRRKSVWVKAHIAVGVKTNVITAVRILDKDAADCPQFDPLTKATAENFAIREMSADMAYSSLEAFELVAGFGGTAFIPFKSNATGAAGGLFEKMFHYFQFRRDEFMAHYHKRSNVESTFSAVKRKFGDSVRSKSDVAMTNEVLCKFLCHNLCCLIQEQCELRIEPVFWQDAGAAPVASQPETNSRLLIRN